ncbi:hypothetical protein EB796_004543 [Bugula neritina]|uniref:Uncharacterized protein n=1 Tax=Bugula neritina TaxID=10212 RepID=A0A7J7KFX7_BUGNE|nr:hypothetical protein EB796_004543 [Bugula neritina]
MNVLHAELNQDDKAAIATIDPTKVGERTWNHWNNAIIPERISVQQKQEAREARQAERERLLKLRKQQEIQARLQEQPRFPVRDGSVPDDALAQELAEERRRHEAHNLSYQKELKALRQEIQELKGEPAPNDRSYSVQSYERLTAPPPSRTSGNSILPVEVAPAKSMPTATNILLDVMSAVADKFRKVAHGEGREGEKLRDATKQYIQEHEEDDRQAQLKIFGKELKVGEFESLKEPEKTRKGERVKQISNKRFEDRWAAKNA